MVLQGISGIGGLQAALEKTNELLADVLAELRETNGQRLESIHTELQHLNVKVDGLEPRATP